MTTALKSRLGKLESRLQPPDEPITVFFSIFDPSPSGPGLTALVSGDGRRSVNRDKGEEETAFIARAESALLATE